MLLLRGVCTACTEQRGGPLSSGMQATFTYPLCFLSFCLFLHAVLLSRVLCMLKRTGVQAVRLRVWTSLGWTGTPAVPCASWRRPTHCGPAQRPAMQTQQAAGKRWKASQALCPPQRKRQSCTGGWLRPPCHQAAPVRPLAPFQRLQRDVLLCLCHLPTTPSIQGPLSPLSALLSYNWSGLYITSSPPCLASATVGWPHCRQARIRGGGQLGAINPGAVWPCHYSTLFAC